ncbi:hypothetical protein QF049_005271 [Paenibacillus sp. W4I10]|nr:hypothetical protein [Paenibacillus sp. W4I10]
MVTGPMFSTLHFKRSRFQKVADYTKKVLIFFMYRYSAGIEAIQNLFKPLIQQWIWNCDLWFVCATNVYLYPQLKPMKRQNSQNKKHPYWDAFGAILEI